MIAKRAKTKWLCSAVGRFLLTAIETHSTAFHHHYPSYILISYPCIIQNVVLLLLTKQQLNDHGQKQQQPNGIVRCETLPSLPSLTMHRNFKLTFRKRGRAGGVWRVVRIRWFEVDPLFSKMFTWCGKNTQLRGKESSRFIHLVILLCNKTNQKFIFAYPKSLANFTFMKAK